jgi:hypothetical protein
MSTFHNYENGFCVLRVKASAARFAHDSPLEEGGFELLVPRVRRTLTAGAVRGVVGIADGVVSGC